MKIWKTILCIIAVIVSVAPCKADDDDIRLSHFDEDGIASDVAKYLNYRKHWGFIDKTGKFVISPSFDRVKKFSNGVAIVQKGEHCYPINRSGKVLGPPHTRMEVNTEANERRWALEAKEREAQEKFKYKGEIWDRTGKTHIASAAEVKLSVFSEGLAACEIPEQLMGKFAPNAPIQPVGILSPHGYKESLAPADRKLNRYGYIDERGRMVIPPRFYSANDFHNGVASVDHWETGLQPNAQKSGYINTEGGLIGGRYFDTAWEFKDGFGIIRKQAMDGIDTEWGFIDDHGRQIMNDYIDVNWFSEGLAGVQLKNGKWGFINKEGRMVVAPQFDLVSYESTDGLRYVKNSAGFGFIDKTGNVAIRPQFTDADAFSEGLAAAAIDAPQEEKQKRLTANAEWHCGFIDVTGHQAIGPRFYGARHFAEGLCAVQDGLKWGFIDLSGKTVIEAQFDAVMSFSEGLAAVMKNDKWGFIDKTGKYVIEPTLPAYDRGADPIKAPKDFSEKCALVCGTNLDWHFINTNGQEPFRMHCVGGGDQIAKSFSEGLAAVDDKDFGNVGFVDHAGHLQIAHKFEKAESFSEGLAAVHFSPKPSKTVQLPFPFEFPSEQKDYLPAKYGYIDKSGEFVVNPQFDYCGSFKNGLAPVGFDKPVHSEKESGWTVAPGSSPKVSWGFINRSGNIVIKAAFDEVQEFSQGLACVRVGDKWGIIDTTGNYVVKPIFQSARHFCDGWAAAKLQDKWGFIDKNGKFVIPAKYWLCGSFSNGRALVVIPGKLTATPSTDETWTAPPLHGTEYLRFYQRGVGPSGDSWEGHL